MFSFSKIANELVSSWDLFLGEYKSNFLNNDNLGNSSFSKDMFEEIIKLGLNISYDDFIYLHCIQNNNFKEAIEEQISSGHLSKDYVSNTKPNEFLVKMFSLFKNLVSKKDYSFIKKYSTQLSFVYNMIDFAITKVKFLGGKLYAKDIRSLNIKTKAKLASDLLTKNKETFVKFYNEVKEITNFKNDLYVLITSIEDFLKEIENEFKDYKIKTIKFDFGQLKENFDKNNYSNFVISLQSMIISLNNMEKNDMFISKQSKISKIISNVQFVKDKLYGSFLYDFEDFYSKKDEIFSFRILKDFRTVIQYSLNKLNDKEISYIKSGIFTLEDLISIINSSIYRYLTNHEYDCNNLLFEKRLDKF